MTKSNCELRTIQEIHLDPRLAPRERREPFGFAQGRLWGTKPMPELPDITAYLTALEKRIVGQPLEKVRLGSPFLLRTADPPLSDAYGKVVSKLRRVGKRIAIGVEGDLWLVLHLMIAGRLHWRPAGAKLAGRKSLAAFDFPNGSLVLTEAGTKHRASLHVVKGEEALEGLDAGGIDVFAADRQRLGRRHRRQPRTGGVSPPDADGLCGG